ncbi:MAG: hypothetical protein JNL08_11860 [Planctomycetes bacterium]|nr:hypothetical protein [Planctomycetota bacterium]
MASAPPSAAAAPPLSLRAYLALGLLLRLPAVFAADGFEFVDQQYQYVDPAWHLATGQAWHVTWEWIDGVRSHVYPGLLAGLFVVLRPLVGDEPATLLGAVRACHAIASLLPLWLFWLSVVRWWPVASTRLPLLLFAGSGLLVTTGVQPSGPALAATLAVAAALAVQGPRAFPWLGGLLLGLAFACRFQEALFGPALLAVLLVQRRRGAACAFACGCVPGILLQGGVDLAVHGRFLASVTGYVSTNLEGAAVKWKQQPWWFYLAAGVLPVLALVPPWWRAAWRRAVAGARVLPAAAAAGLLHIAVHSCLARKALRFEYGALAMLTAVAAAGLAAAPLAGERLAVWHRRALAAVHAVLWLYASFWFGNAGAVRMARALRGDPGLAHELVVVDGDATSLGGYFHLRPPADCAVRVPRAELAARLRRAPPPAGALVVAVREPLADDLLREFALAPAGAFTGQFDLRTGERRFVYRRR